MRRVVFESNGDTFAFYNKNNENKGENSMKKLYNAGSLFNDKEADAREKDQNILRGISRRQEGGFEFYNPLFNESINDKSNNPTAADIYNGDVKELISSSILAIDGDDLERDPGVSWEAGMVAGINLMLEKIFELAPAEVYDKISSKIPMKEVYVTYTDCRLPQDGIGIHKPVGFNQFCIGYFDQMGNLFEGKGAREKMFKQIEKDLEEGK